MRFRIFVSLMVAGSFAVLAITGLMIFFGYSSKTTDMLHSVFGVVFLLSALPHLANNLRALKSYVSQAGRKNA